MINLYSQKAHGFAAIVMTIVLTVVGFTTVQARTISESEARNMAKSFMLQKQIITSSQEISLVRSAAHNGSTYNAPSAPQLLYIFNADNSNGGFVIVSGDDRAMPVLGYCDHGSYNPADLPPAMQYWIEYLQSEILSLEGTEEDGSTIDNNIIMGARASIAPMLKSQWNQNEPFNLKLPKVNNGNTAATGCVATAMAQVMYYYKWPNSTSTTIPSYTSETQSIYMPSLATTTFSWSSMKDFYMRQETGTAADAVAKLMLYCAQALEMDFKNSSSSASTADAGDALVKYFRYSPTTRYLNRRNYNTTTWESYIYNELAAKRPVMYRGQTLAGGGHSFICDGYDSSTNMFHFNWGWSGASDGYYLLTALKPKYQGIGSSNGTEGYIGGQAVVIGIAPNNVAAPSTSNSMTISSISLNSTSYSRSSASQDFTGIKFKARLNNNTGITQSFYSRWVLYKNGQFVKYLGGSTYQCSYTDLQNTWGGEREYNLTIDSSIGNGTYILYPVSQIKGNNDWTLCSGINVHYIEATVTSTKLTLKCYGIGGTIHYSANNINFGGNMNVGKLMPITANLNNSGTTMNDLIYMHVNGDSATMALATIEPGKSGDLIFNYLPDTYGSKNVSFSVNKDGSNPFATRSIYVKQMPEANLSISYTIDNSGTENGERIVKGNTLTINTKLTNNLSNAYYEDIVLRLLHVNKSSGGSYYGVFVDDFTAQNVSIFGNSSKNISHSFKNLVVGDKYWVRIVYYSNGEEKYTQTNVYKIVEGNLKGDLDNNGIIDVEDVNAAINIILKVKSMNDYPGDGDMDNNGIIDVEDVNAIINIILKLN
ncbi:MAG: C10 family peptidase [Muribaculaceae bacterium]|nr:C10 family peptidase [Muribaculaceae bacterium]